jgi:hypothetical protein
MDVRTLATVANLLSVARRRTRAQAGTVYRREVEGLTFLVAQNDELDGGSPSGVDLLTRSALRWTEPSIASYVALTDTALNVADAYEVPKSKPYAFNRRFDIMTGFRTISMLSVPLHSPILGVLQLINATNEHGDVVAFSEAAERAVEDVTARTLARA